MEGSQSGKNLEPEADRRINLLEGHIPNQSVSQSVSRPAAGVSQFSQFSQIKASGQNTPRIAKTTNLNDSGHMGHP